MLFIVNMILSLFLWTPLGLAAEPSESESPPQTFIFVSLSMPETSLKALYQEAEQRDAVLVLRGLKEHSFKKTAEALQALGIAVQINPDLFTKHAIQRVPTFLRIQGSQVHRMTGNLSLAYALGRFEADSDA